MINNFKLGIKMFRYGTGLVGMMVCCGIFLALALIYNSLGTAGSFGDFFLMMVPIYPVQIIYTISISSFIASSPVKKRMQTSVPATICCFNMIAIYLVNALCKGIMLAGHPENIGTACGELLSLAGFGVIFMLYIGLAYKYFAVSIVMGIIVYFYTINRLNGVNTAWPHIFENSAGSFALALLIGLVCIVIGGFGQYGLALLVYKAPISKYALSAVVRKEM